MTCYTLRPAMGKNRQKDATTTMFPITFLRPGSPLFFFHDLTNVMRIFSERLSVIHRGICGYRIVA